MESTGSNRHHAPQVTNRTDVFPVVWREFGIMINCAVYVCSAFSYRVVRAGDREIDIVLLVMQGRVGGGGLPVDAVMWEHYSYGRF